MILWSKKQNKRFYWKIVNVSLRKKKKYSNSKNSFLLGGLFCPLPPSPGYGSGFILENFDNIFEQWSSFAACHERQV